MNQLPQFKTILYVTDLGERTRPVFKHALSLARAYQARVVMLHVVEPMGSAVEAVLSAYLSQDVRDKVERDGLKKLVERMRQRLEDFRNEEAELAELGRLVSDVVVVHGQPDEEIIEQADKHHADLIVIGSTTGERHLLGTTARRISQFSTIPVLIVPNSKESAVAD